MSKMVWLYMSLSNILCIQVPCSATARVGERRYKRVVELVEGSARVSYITSGFYNSVSSPSFTVTLQPFNCIALSYLSHPLLNEIICSRMKVGRL